MDPSQNVPINLPSINGAGDDVGTVQPVKQTQAVVATQPMSTDANASSVNGSSTSIQVSAPASANDVDLIEKEWVQKVKSIVDQTKDDPFEQSKQLTLLKADYMQKRYNKSIKLA